MDHQRDFAFRIEHEPIFFAENYLSKFFYLPFATFQHDMIERLLKAKNQVNIVYVPRGFGKTTTVTCLLTIWYALFKGTRHIVLVSQTAERAQGLLEDVKSVLELPEFVETFGDLAGKWWGAKRASLFSEQFGVDCTLTALSLGGQLRGIKVNGVRPELVFVDDAEDDEDVENPNLVAKTERWVNKKLLPALRVDDALDISGQVIWLATTIANDSAVQRVSAYPGVQVLNYPALVDSEEMSARLRIPMGCSIWEEKMSTASLKALRDELIDKGMSTVWYNEYQNDPKSSNEIIFHEGNNRTFMENELEGMEIPMYMAIDAAYGAHKQNCNTGIAIGGFNWRKDLYAWDCIEKKMSPDVLFDTVVERLKYYEKTGRPIQEIGIESTSYEYVAKLMKERVWDTERINVGIRKLEHKNVNKLDRIRMLVPWHSMRRLLVKEGMREFLAQLVRFPSRKGGIDGLDAMAYIPQMARVPKKEDDIVRLPSDNTTRAIAERFRNDAKAKNSERYRRGSGMVDFSKVRRVRPTYR
jgi:hypothetical protein